ncbi:hypothetical protein STRDD11_01655 [Streptococcus sp. DD11]|nr:hypothetical protein STRDD11_01655 [Streptococcus sp. DD11]
MGNTEKVISQPAKVDLKSTKDWFFQCVFICLRGLFCWFDLTVGMELPSIRKKFLF